MGIVTSKDGPPDTAQMHLLRALSHKASCHIALQQHGEIEAGGEIHGYVEVDVKDPKEIGAGFDDRDRYKYSYDELQQLAETHFNRIEVELVSEINTRVRYKRSGHGKKKSHLAAESHRDADNNNSDDDSDADDNADQVTEGNMYAGHIVDSSGGILETNVSNRHLAVERSILYSENKLIAMSAGSDSDALFGNLDAFQAPSACAGASQKAGQKKTKKAAANMGVAPDEVLTPGKHRYPFTFTVPQFAPSTCAIIRSYNGENAATVLARLVVKVQMKGELDKKGVGADNRLEVHSVPVVVRSLPPKDPAFGSALAPVGMGVGATKHSVDATWNGTLPLIYDADGVVNENPLTTPLVASIVRGDRDDDDTSSLASGSSAIVPSPVQGQPFVIASVQMVSCWCVPCCAGHISLQARSEKYIYSLDEPIQVSWEISNMSRSKTVKQVSIDLIRKCQWSAKGHTYESELILAQICRNGTGGSKSGATLQSQSAGSGAGLLSSSADGGQTSDDDANVATICCPPSDPTSILCCSSISTSLLTVTYYIKVVARIYAGQGSCCVSNPSTIIPLHMYSRFSSEMNVCHRSPLTGKSNDKRSSRNKSTTAEGNDWKTRKLVPFTQTDGRYDINTRVEEKRYMWATEEFNKLFTMYDGLSYVSHEESNLVAPLSEPEEFLDVHL